MERSSSVAGGQVPVEGGARVKSLAELGASVAVDFNVPCRRYYRSGQEMVRMANVYLQEGNLENSYILYIKFMTLFIEKIRKHPEYSSIPADVKAKNQIHLKEVMPKAEKLKAKLLDQYNKEYKECLENEKKSKEAEVKAKLEREKKEQENKILNERNSAGIVMPSAPFENPLWNVVSPAPNLPDVLYPDDFATEPNRTPPGFPNSVTIPPVIRDNKPSTIPSTSDSYPTPPSTTSSLLSGGSSLRKVIVPNSLMDRFLNLAASNTKNKVETCAILAGTLERDRLLITHMIVPKQTGTADSCVTKNEEELFHYQDQYNLITIGWIHTHPTQTAFLSSVDLHTQCSYQLMMPEAIAIVCAPKYNETGYFSLTPYYGMSYISNCRESGFHPHPNDPPLFMNVSHITLDQYASLEVVDLRR